MDFSELSQQLLDEAIMIQEAVYSRLCSRFGYLKGDKLYQQFIDKMNSHRSQEIRAKGYMDLKDIITNSPDDYAMIQCEAVGVADEYIKGIESKLKDGDKSV